MDMAQLNLLDMLDEAPAWMQCMVLAVGPRHPGHRPLFRCCSKLQQLVLQQRSLRPRLRCCVKNASEFGTLTHVRALAMAEASPSNVYLGIEGPWFGPDDGCPNSIGYNIVAAFTQAAFIHGMQTCQIQQPPAPYKLQCITTISLSSVHLDSLVPDFLVLGCPNLKVLHLECVTVTGSGPPAQSICTSLQRLYLNEADVLEPTLAIQHLPNLPSLTELCIGELVKSVSFSMGAMFYAAIDKYSAHLRFLDVYDSSDDTFSLGDVYDQLPWTPGTLFPHLRSLHLYNWVIECDEDMHQLLEAASSAIDVQLHSIYGLETSFAQEPCSWQELALEHVVYVDQLALLPLSSCTCLVRGVTIQLRSLGSPAPTPEQITAGVAAAQAAGGLSSVTSTRIILYTDDLPCLTAAAPLLQHTQGSALVEVRVPGTFKPAPLSESLPLLTVLGQHLKCKEVSIVIFPLSDDVSNVEELEHLARQLMPHVDQPTFTDN